MTVQELREKIANLDGSTPAVVCEEDEASLHFFEIDDVAIRRGKPSRLEDGKAAFAFDTDGPASWLFINVTPA
ncbi:MAG TPA: hypothetical protein VGW33_07700 [Terriglobia bacterium]|nr:hypothetical protein [Terriglobia bacterium]